MKITVKKGGLENVEANQWFRSVLLRGKVSCVMPQSVRQSSGERGSSNEDQVKKQLLLMGPTWNHSIGCVKSSTKQLMPLTAKVEKLSNMFSKLQLESEKLKKKLENCGAYKELLGFSPFRQYRQLAGRFDSFLIFSRNNELGDIVILVVRTKSMIPTISWELKF